MSGWRPRAWLLTLLLPALVGALAAPSAADGRGRLVDRNVHEQTFDSGTVAPDRLGLELCDLRLRVTGSVTVVESVFANGTIMLRINEETQWYDFDTGELLLSQRDREILTERPVSETVDEAAGTRTVVLEVDYRGVPLRLLRPNQGVVSMTAGFLKRVVTLVFDLETAELLSEDIEVTHEAGQWPFSANDGSLDFERFVAFSCSQLSAP